MLRYRRLGDADRIVTLLTPARGKIDVVAKGVLRPRSKLAGHLEPAMHVDVVLAHGRNLDIVTQAQTIESFAELREDLDRLSSAIYLAELSDRFTIEHAEARPVYELLHASLVRLACGDGWHLVTRSFELAAAGGHGLPAGVGRLHRLRRRCRARRRSLVGDRRRRDLCRLRSRASAGGVDQRHGAEGAARVPGRAV